MPFRIGVIGPFRRRAGTGPFVSEFLRRSGCEVLAWDRQDARRLLDPAAGRPDVDAVAICSPAEKHFDYLAAAIAKGLHVFCEKPVVWPRNHSCAEFGILIAGLGQTLDAAFRTGLVVHENTQWVYTLNELGAAPRCTSHFRCELSPSEGSPAGMMMECSAHANSLLLELGCSGMEQIRMRFEPGGAALDCDFLSRGSCGPVQVQYRFCRQFSQPRHAAYEIDDLRVERRVDLNGYRVFLNFASGEREIRDPLQSSVEDFVAKVVNGTHIPFSRILSNIRMSALLLDACRILPEAPHA